MPSTIIVTDKQGRRYAYRSTSYWDKQKKAPRTRREYLGRVGPDGQILPKKQYTSQPTGEPQQTTAPVSGNSSEIIALLNQISTRLDRIEAVIFTLSDAWKSVDSIVGQGK